MGFSDAAMCHAADDIRGRYGWLQLHTAAAGASYTDNVSSAGREALTWGAASSNGDFDIGAPVDFTGGASSGAVYSATIWTAETNGECGGEFRRVGGDVTFNAAGEYTWTGIANDGNATDG